MRNPKGAITLITLVTILFMLAFLLSSYAIIMNRSQSQAEIKRETGEIYSQEVENMEEIYNSYFADASATIPVKTAEQLLQLGTGNDVVVDGKVYNFSSSANYRLDRAITLDVSDYQTEYPDLFEEENNAIRWVDIEKQIENGTLTGSFNYNGNTITETDTAGNEIIHKYINYVDYIESTGTQYIDTGFIPNQDTSLEMVAETTDVSNAEAGVGFIPYGAGVSYTTQAFECYTQGGQYEFNYAGQYDFIGTAEVGDRISISHNKNVVNIVVGDTEYSKTFTYQTFTAPYVMTLFGINRGTVIPGKLKIYSCEIYDNGVLVRDFKPALDESGVPCLYDTVTNQYFYNAGTGTFNYQ